MPGRKPPLLSAYMPSPFAWLLDRRYGLCFAARGNAHTMGGRAMKTAMIAIVLGLVAAAAGAAQAQNFPTRPVTLIVPWPAGGTTDVVMRALATASEKHLGQSLVIENRGGAAGTLGPGSMAANARPDGYTVAQIPITVFRYPFIGKTSC